MRSLIFLLSVVITAPLMAGIQKGTLFGDSGDTPNFAEILEKVDRIVISETQLMDSYHPARSVEDPAWILAVTMTLVASDPKPSPNCWCYHLENYIFFVGDKQVLKLTLKHDEMALVGAERGSGQLNIGKESVKMLRGLIAQKRAPKVKDKSKGYVPEMKFEKPELILAPIGALAKSE